MENFYTLQEIKQQTKLWLETIEILKNEKKKLEEFLTIHNIHERKIIFTGAGTSEFVGNSVVHGLKGNFLSISTTDIVGNPENYLKKNEKVLLVSFARSGNSPESVATVKLADQIITDICHIIITCNKDGALAISKNDNKKSLVLLMPDKSNDKGFAMTSSFSCMSLASICTFNLNYLDEIESIIKKQILAINHEKIKELVETLVTLNLNRIVYLGSSCLKGVAEESALKCLELTSGILSTHYNSPLGFRHGPKSIINDTTMIVLFMSNNDYTRKYELDLLKEMYNEVNKKTIVVLDMKYSDEVKNNAHYYYSFNCKFNETNEIFNMFNYIYFAQLFGYYKSLSYGINPDNPCPTGEVNRVVKGVIIHEYMEVKKC